MRGLGIFPGQTLVFRDGLCRVELCRFRGYFFLILLKGVRVDLLHLQSAAHDAAHLRCLRARSGHSARCATKADAARGHQTTMNPYGDVLTDEMEQAHAKVVGFALGRAN